MVHADSSNFLSDLSKQDAYRQVIDQTKALCEDQRNWVSTENPCIHQLIAIGLVSESVHVDPSNANSNLANAASLLWHALHALPEPSNRVNWAGFYVLDPSKIDQLILGPFQGKVACQTIAFGRGVCGAAASTATTQLVPDVEEFPGHIACDGDSQSEIVVPILKAGKVM
ncbi:hypothetical protein AMS68_002036 [Peltaster fructicola]|uniref:GAF domain-containing protein n=1 Tax=Peltaster fructicola TaxID=286661 RepID=A0A6H0XPH3_9PEZI|nr:hypothetical protein AMS68_002036 [Peltaster fructicola]